MMVGNFLSNKLNYLFWLVVHTWLLFSIICGIILPIDFIFFKMVKTTNQLLNVVEPTMTSLHPLPKVHHYPPKEMAADVGPSVASSLHRWTQRGGTKTRVFVPQKIMIPWDLHQFWVETLETNLPTIVAVSNYFHCIHGACAFTYAALRIYRKWSFSDKRSGLFQCGCECYHGKLEMLSILDLNQVFVNYDSGKLVASKSWRY